MKKKNSKSTADGNRNHMLIVQSAMEEELKEKKLLTKSMGMVLGFRYITVMKLMQEAYKVNLD